jgi:hypothetical protein
MRTNQRSLFIPTQSVPNAKRRLAGSPPVRMVLTTRFCFGSMRCTVPGSSLEAQTAPAPTATSHGRLPTRTRRTTPMRRGSTRSNVLVWYPSTQSADPSAATPHAPDAIFTLPMTRF